MSLSLILQAFRSNYAQMDALLATLRPVTVRTIDTARELQMHPRCTAEAAAQAREAELRARIVLKCLDKVPRLGERAA